MESGGGGRVSCLRRVAAMDRDVHARRWLLAGGFIRTLVPYDDLEGIHARLSALGDVQTFGTSVEGRPLWVVRIGASSERRALVTGAIHGVEYIGTRAALVFAESLMERPLDAEVWVAPVLNPDGYARTWREGGAAPIASVRRNARGVDLNRNFPLPWSSRPGRMPFTGSTSPSAATYRGPAPLSEPEARALASLALRLEPRVAAGLHSFMGALIPARVTHLSDWRHYSQMTRAFREGHGGFPYLRLGSPVGDVFTGELEDWLHHVVRCWAVCIECFPVWASLLQGLRAPAPFWRFNPRDPSRWERRDAEGIRAMIEVGLDGARPPERAGAGACLEVW